MNVIILAKPLPQFAGSRADDMKKAIILSAGQGSRLGHLTDDRPKCLIEFNGRTLLDRQLDALAANGVEEAVVVTGFRDDQIEAALKRRGDIGPRVRTVYNPFYKVADNLGSLFVAKARDRGRRAGVERRHAGQRGADGARRRQSQTRKAFASPSTARTAMTRTT